MKKILIEKIRKNDDGQIIVSGTIDTPIENSNILVDSEDFELRVDEWVIDELKKLIT